jgi:hypothetical protein
MNIKIRPHVCIDGRDEELVIGQFGMQGVEHVDSVGVVSVDKEAVELWVVIDSPDVCGMMNSGADNQGFEPKNGV